MKVIVEFVLFLFLLSTVCCGAYHDANTNLDAGMDIAKYLQKYGYPLETHWVQTEDGYMLRMHRLHYDRTDTLSDKAEKKPAVLLMHGLLGSSMDFVYAGPGQALALILVEAGYDVWLGNNRGNTWSKNHVTMDPDIDAEFWEYSFETLGMYDLPAKIDYILETTRHKRVMYIGHAQGATQFFAMAAMKPEYNEKIAAMVALAPVAYVSHLSSPVFKILLNNMDVLNYLESMKVHELLGRSGLPAAVMKLLSISPYQDICAPLLFFMYGFDDHQLNKTLIPLIFSNTPAGISLQMLKHYAQLHATDSFKRFDYGEEKNVELYGSSVPPEINLTTVSAPVFLYYSKNDLVASIADVKRLENELPNVVNSTLIDYKYFNHYDFLIANNAPDVLYDDVMSILKDYSAEEDVDYPTTTDAPHQGGAASYLSSTAIIFVTSVLLMLF